MKPTKDQRALLLAVDPAGVGDRLVGYQVGTGAVRPDAMRTFLRHLKDAGVEPDEVSTDATPRPCIPRSWRRSGPRQRTSCASATRRGA